MDDLEALTCDMASTILQREAESRGSQQTVSLNIAKLILSEVESGELVPGRALQSVLREQPSMMSEPWNFRQSRSHRFKTGDRVRYVGRGANTDYTKRWVGTVAIVTDDRVAVRWDDPRMHVLVSRRQYASHNLEVVDTEANEGK